MSILVNKNTRVIVQGMTGSEGKFHTGQMLQYGTKVVGGVTPGKGGSFGEFGEVKVPVFNTVQDAIRQTGGVDASVIFVPPPAAADAILESVNAGLKLIVTITEGIPIHDMVRVRKVLKDEGVRMIGPNCPGLITPGESKLGIMPGGLFSRGPVGFVSRSGTLTYQVVDELTRAGLGQTTCVGIGGDPINGTSFRDVLELLHQDSETKVTVLIGEIGGSQEEEAAEYIAQTKMKVVSFIGGRTAPEGKKMGHAGAIVSGGKGTAAAKVKAFEDAGVPVAETTGEIIERVAAMLGQKVTA
ncbi:MAG: succinate--CoA ligase subunit alpha [Candidatus Xenobia bacterium]